MLKYLKDYNMETINITKKDILSLGFEEIENPDFKPLSEQDGFFYYEFKKNLNSNTYIHLMYTNWFVSGGKTADESEKSDVLEYRIIQIKIVHMDMIEINSYKFRADIDTADDLNKLIKQILGCTIEDYV